MSRTTYREPSTDGKRWISGSRPALSSRGILDTSAESYLPLEKRQDGLFLPVSIENSPPQGGRRTEGKQAAGGRAPPPRATYAPRRHRFTLPTLRVWDELGNPGRREPLQTREIYFKSPLLPGTFQSSEIFLLLQFAHCKNQHNLSSGGKGADFSLVFGFVFYFLKQQLNLPLEEKLGDGKGKPRDHWQVEVWK